LSAENVNRERIAEAPADPHAWMRLAALRAARLGVDQTVLEALRMSRLTGRREFAVMWPSLKFRVDHWDRMPDEEKDAASDMVVGLWLRASRRDLFEYFRSLPHGMRLQLLAHMHNDDAKSSLEARAMNS